MPTSRSEVDGTRLRRLDTESPDDGRKRDSVPPSTAENGTGEEQRRSQLEPLNRDAVQAATGFTQPCWDP